MTGKDPSTALCAVFEKLTMRCANLRALPSGRVTRASLRPLPVIPNECEESRRETALVGGPFDYAQGDRETCHSEPLLSPRACRGIPLSNLSFRTNVRNPMGKPLYRGDPSTSLRVTENVFVRGFFAIALNDRLAEFL